MTTSHWEFQDFDGDSEQFSKDQFKKIQSES